MHRARLRLRLVGLAFGLFVYSVARGSVAGERTLVRLVYVCGAGARGCPPQMQLRMAVAARLGYDPFSATAPRTVIAQIQENLGELEGRVELSNDENVSQGARKLSAPLDRCSELVRAMALSISIAIDPENALLTRSEPAPPEGNANPEKARAERAAAAPKGESPEPIEVRQPPRAPSIRFFQWYGLACDERRGAGKFARRRCVRQWAVRAGLARARTAHRRPQFEGRVEWQRARFVSARVARALRAPGLRHTVWHRYAGRGSGFGVGARAGLVGHRQLQRPWRARRLGHAAARATLGRPSCRHFCAVAPG